MANSKSEDKRAIAKITGKDLPLFVPTSISEQVAKLVRDCILQSGKTRSVIVSQKVFALLSANLKKYSKPKYTISQYLLIVLSSVNTIELLIKRHNSGKISDQEFINAIKGVTNADERKTKSPRKVGGQKMAIDGSDRAVDADEIH